MSSLGSALPREHERLRAAAAEKREPHDDHPLRTGSYRERRHDRVDDLRLDSSRTPSELPEHDICALRRSIRGKRPLGRRGHRLSGAQQQIADLRREGSLVTVALATPAEKLERALDPECPLPEGGSLPVAVGVRRRQPDPGLGLPYERLGRVRPGEHAQLEVAHTGCVRLHRKQAVKRREYVEPPVLRAQDAVEREQRRGRSGLRGEEPFERGLRVVQPSPRLQHAGLANHPPLRSGDLRRDGQGHQEECRAHRQPQGHCPHAAAPRAHGGPPVP